MNNTIKTTSLDVSLCGFLNDTEDHLEALHDMYFEFMNQAVKRELSDEYVGQITYTYSELRFFLQDIAKKEKEIKKTEA